MFSPEARYLKKCGEEHQRLINSSDKMSFQYQTVHYICPCVLK